MSRDILDSEGGKEEGEGGGGPWESTFQILLSSLPKASLTYEGLSCALSSCINSTLSTLPVSLRDSNLVNYMMKMLSCEQNKRGVPKDLPVSLEDEKQWLMSFASCSSDIPNLIQGVETSQGELDRPVARLLFS